MKPDDTNEELNGLRSVHSQTIAKLKHKIPEIRLRALRSINAKLPQYISGDQKDVFGNATSLIRALIDWFSVQPMLEEDTVLDLLRTVFMSIAGGDAIQALGADYLSRKFDDIRLKLTLPQSNETLRNIQKILTNYVVRPKTIERKDLPPIFERDDLPPISEEPPLTPRTPRLSYESPWQVPWAADLNSMRQLGASLRNPLDAENVEHGLKFLTSACDDLPGEFFLQPPYIVLDLITLLQSSDHNTYSATLIRQCTHLTRALRKRVLERKLTQTRLPFASTSVDDNHHHHHHHQQQQQTVQINVVSFVHEIFDASLNRLKMLIDHGNQAEINAIFVLMQELVHLLETDSERGSMLAQSEANLRGLVADFGHLLKYFRHRSPDTIIQPLNSVLNSCASSQTASTDISAEHFFERHIYVTLFGVMLQLIDVLIVSHSACDLTETIQMLSPVVLEELQKSLLDYPLKRFFPELLDNARKFVAMDNATLEIIDCENALRPAVELLRSSGTPSGLDVSECNLDDALSAVNHMQILRSAGLASKLIETVFSASARLESAPNVQRNCEQILLRLMAIDVVSIKRIVYSAIAARAKHFFGSVMDGSAMPMAKFKGNSTQSIGQILGMPITKDVIIELICFGTVHPDAQIKTQAVDILLILLRCKSLLSGQCWSEIWLALAPTFPLLQSLSTKTTQLGSEILKLLNPDSSALDPDALLLGNIRLLFHKSSDVRAEAMSRVLYCVSLHPEADRYLPNIPNILDVIPSDICVLANRWDASVAAATPILYTAETVASLVTSLATRGVDPKVRRVTLMQLNVIAAVPSLCKVIIAQNGLRYTIEALQNSLMTAHNVDYPDAALSAVGLLAKLCVHSFNARRLLLAGEANVLLFRAMLLFHKNEALQRDCAIALFVIAFADFILSESTLSVPQLLVDRFHVPIVCNTHWSVSPFIGQSPLTQVLASHQPQSPEWQFVRFTVASLFFSDTTPDKIYSNHPIIYPSLEFNPELHLTRQDCSLLQSSDSVKFLTHNLQSVTNATTHSAVVRALANIQSLTIVRIDRRRIGVDVRQEIVKVMRRFLCVLPNTVPDQSVFLAVMDTVLDLIGLGIEELLAWTLHQLCRQPQCAFLVALQSSDAPPNLVQAVCRFLKLIIRRAIQSSAEDASVLKMLTTKLSGMEDINVLVYLYERVVGMLDGKFERREFDQLRSLLSLLCTITQPIAKPALRSIFVCDANATDFIANKLFKFVVSIKSLAQTGSAFNHNCLRVVANLLHSLPASISTFALSPKYVRLCSALCGHASIKLRLAAWSVLSGLAQSFAGASELVKVLAQLPGGFHACCLSTFLDDHETSAVRQSAGALLVQLLQHNTRDRHIKPMSVAISSIESTEVDLNTIICEMLKCHQFYTIMIEQLQRFWDEDNEPAAGTIARPFITCDVVRTFCAIVVQLLAMSPDATFAELQTHGLVMHIFRLTPIVIISTNEASVRMLVEVCKVVSRCLQLNDHLLDAIALEEQAILSALVASLDPTIYDSVTPQLRTNFLQGLLTIVTPITQRIAIVSAQDLDAKQRIECLAKLFHFALQPNQNDELLQLSLNLLRNLLTFTSRSAASMYDELLFVDLFDNRLMDESDRMNSESGCARLFCLLLALIRSKRKDNSASSSFGQILSTMALMLRHSDSARCVANGERWFFEILNEIDAVHARLDGVSCADFLRRFGEAKKEPIISSLRMWFSALLHWFSSVCISGSDDPDNTQPSSQIEAQNFGPEAIQRFCLIVVRTWPWTGADKQLQLVFMRSLAFACEDSVPVCKAMSTVRNSSSSSSSTVLQLSAELATSETTKAKCPSGDLQLLSLSLAIVSNCCSCIEGRQFVWKTNFLDAMSRFHPSLTKRQKPWPSIIRLWLQFYEIISRHQDQSTRLKHLSLLCTFVLKPMGHLAAELRVQSLEIVRNFAFNAACRPTLLASDELMHVLKCVLDQGTPVEQLLVATSIWRLAANCYKAKHVFRMGSVLDALWSLKGRIGQMDLTDATTAADGDDSRREVALVIDALGLIFEK